MLIPKVKSRLEYGHTEAYVAPRQDNLEITHLHLGSPERPPRTQLSYEGLPDPRTFNFAYNRQSPTLDEASNPSTETLQDIQSASKGGNEPLPGDVRDGGRVRTWRFT